MELAAQLVEVLVPELEFFQTAGKIRHRTSIGFQSLHGALGKGNALLRGHGGQELVHDSDHCITKVLSGNADSGTFFGGADQHVGADPSTWSATNDQTSKASVYDRVKLD
jgi:hypothetical protein